MKKILEQKNTCLVAQEVDRLMPLITAKREMEQAELANEEAANKAMFYSQEIEQHGRVRQYGVFEVGDRVRYSTSFIKAIGGVGYHGTGKKSRCLMIDMEITSHYGYKVGKVISIDTIGGVIMPRIDWGAGNISNVRVENLQHTNH